VFYVIARTRPGVSAAQVKSELATLRAGVRRTYPKLASAPGLIPSCLAILSSSRRTAWGRLIVTVSRMMY